MRNLQGMNQGMNNETHRCEKMAKNAGILWNIGETIK
jgi:hypothetical protein